MNASDTVIVLDNDDSGELVKTRYVKTYPTGASVDPIMVDALCQVLCFTGALFLFCVLVSGRSWVIFKRFVGGRVRPRNGVKCAPASSPFFKDTELIRSAPPVCRRRVGFAALRR